MKKHQCLILAVGVVALAPVSRAQSSSIEAAPAPTAAGTAADAAPGALPSPAPHARGLLFGASLGGGRLQDEVMGVGGVSLEAHVGYFPTRWLGIAGSGAVFAHTIDDQRTLRLFSGALLAEVHPLDRLWLAAGPGYYSLSLSVGDAADATKEVEAKSQNALGGELSLGFDIYRAQPPGGLSTGVVLRSQVASFDGQPLFSTLGLINLRWYGGGSSAQPKGALQPATTPGATVAPDALAVTSSCGDPVGQLLSVLELGGRPCAYRVGAAGVASQATSFATRLLQGTSFGVWLGRLTGVGNAVRGLSVQYDAAQRTIQLLRHDARGVTASGTVPVAAGAVQRWRVVRTPRKALVWLDDRLVVSENGGFGSEVGILSDSSRVELGQAEQAKLDAGRARELEGVEAVSWPALEAPATAEPVAESAPVEPEAPAAPADPRLLLLRQYYTGVSGGGFDASRYFAPRVARYLTMRDTTPGAIQGYVDRTLPRQFQRVRFEMDEATLQSEGPGQVTYVERASYYNVALGKHEKLVSQVRARFDEQGRLTHLWQDKVLERHAE